MVQVELRGLPAFKWEIALGCWNGHNKEPDKHKGENKREPERTLKTAKGTTDQGSCAGAMEPGVAWLCAQEEEIEFRMATCLCCSD